jgi:ABC-2 type transport system permease protein
MRTKVAFFFTFVFPLVFLFVYAGLFAHGNPDSVAYVFGPVVTLNIMSTGFWGLGLQSVVQRERGSLRRYRLAPIGAGAMVSSSLLANYLLELPTIALLLFCAMVFFHMPLKIGLGSLLVLVTIGTFAFAGFGLTIASVANTMQEAQVYNNIAWLTLLFLSGTTVPLPILPHWIQRVAVFLPATYLVSSFQAVMIQSEPLRAHSPEMAGLAVAGLFGLLFAWKLFRWEKEERIANSRKLMALVFLLPFLLIGIMLNRRLNLAATWALSLSMSAQPARRFSRGAASQSHPPATANLTEEQKQLAPPPPGSDSGLVSDFDEGQILSANFGFGWVVSTDRQQQDGKSNAIIKVVSGGAEGSKGSLLITGEVAPGSSEPRAGAMFLASVEPFAPANLSARKEIGFWAKGDGKKYRLMILGGSDLDYFPAAHTFLAGPEWKQYSFRLSDFLGTDSHGIRGVLFTAGPAPGKFSFQLDDVRFR